MADNKQEHGLYTGEHPAHAESDAHGEMNAEILADREWMFGKFVSWSAWTVAFIFLILAFLALTQT